MCVLQEKAADRHKQQAQGKTNAPARQQLALLFCLPKNAQVTYTLSDTGVKTLNTRLLKHLSSQSLTPCYPTLHSATLQMEPMLCLLTHPHACMGHQNPTEKSLTPLRLSTAGRTVLRMLLLLVIL